MTAVDELRAARVTLTALVREQRWALRRSEAALAATSEALSLLEHDPVLQAISATTDDPAESVDDTPAVTQARIADDTAVKIDDQADDPVPARPCGQHVRRPVGRPTPWDWQQVCDTIAALQADGARSDPRSDGPVWCPRSAAKNWPAKIAKLGLTPTPPSRRPLPPRHSPRSARCKGCDAPTAAGRSHSRTTNRPCSSTSTAG
jgi:hypothetical protein